MLRCLILTLIVLYTSLGVGQNFANKDFYLVDSIEVSRMSDKERNALDSLLTHFHKDISDTSKINALRLVPYLCFNDHIWPKYNVFLIDFINEKLSKKNSRLIQEKMQKDLGEALNNRAYALSYILPNANPDEIKKLYEDALKIAENLKDRSDMSSCLSNIGVLEVERGNLTVGIDYFLRAVKISEEDKEYDDCIIRYNNIATIFADLERYNEALAYNKKAFYYSQKDGVDSLGRASAYRGLGISFDNLGFTDSARVYLNQALNIYMKHDRKIKIASIYANIGNTYSKITNPNEALYYYRQSVDFFNQINDQDGMIFPLAYIGEILTTKGRINDALDTLELAHNLSLSTGVPQDIKVTSHLLYEAYHKAGDWEKSLQYYKDYVEIKDSLYNLDARHEIIQKTEEFEYKKKKALDDAENEKKLALEIQKKRQNQVIVFFVIGVAVLLIIMLVVIVKRLRLIKNQKQLIEEQAQKLKELDQTKTKFFNNVAHELKTPLTLISGHMESMLSDRFGGLNNNQRKSIQVAKKNNDRLVEMVSEILDLGKLESSKMELNIEHVSLASFVDRIFFTFESYAQQFDIELIQQIDIEKGVLVNIDSGKIEKVLNNLISNAIKYTPRGGQVILHLFLENGQITCAVKDSGIGISKSEISKVFDRYYQSSSRKMLEQGGTGIGLTIVKEYMELHNGSVSVSSEEGKGSTFTIVFPPEVIVDKITSQPIDKQEEDNLALPVQPILKESSFTILVVEDNREMQHYLKDILSDFAKVFVANDGIDALEILSKNKIDLITIDLMMPNMGGFELLNELKTNSEYKDISAIMLTARSAEEDKLNALSIGIDDYITKPFSQKELMARVVNLLQNRKERLVEASDSDKPDIDKDQAFLMKLKTVVSDNLSSSDFGVTELANQMALGDKQLTRTVKRITGLTPLKFIREVKLLAAQDLLKSKKYHTVAEVCYAVGFEKPSYFTQLYTERFGKLPSEYLS